MSFDRYFLGDRFFPSSKLFLFIKPFRIVSCCIEENYCYYFFLFFLELFRYYSCSVRSYNSRDMRIFRNFCVADFPRCVEFYLFWIFVEKFANLFSKIIWICWIVGSTVDEKNSNLTETYKIMLSFFRFSRAWFRSSWAWQDLSPSLCLPNEIDKWKYIYIYGIHHVMRTRYISIFLRKKL